MRPSHSRDTRATRERNTCTPFTCPFARGCMRPDATGEFTLEMSAFAEAVCIQPCAVCKPLIDRAIARISARRTGA
jgi:hypothetical protein